MSLGHRERIAEVARLQERVWALEAENAMLRERLASPAEEIDLREEATRG